ncbi:MAG: hypothetical protein AAF226_13880, partial [Verrucomicrobiota bacterium]
MLNASGLWLSQRTVRWLIVLLALLPLIPASMLVQVILTNAAEERTEAIDSVTQSFQFQLAQLLDRYSAGESRAENVGSPEALESYLRQIFGDQPNLVIHNAQGTPVIGTQTDLDRYPVNHTIDRGALSGW